MFTPLYMHMCVDLSTRMFSLPQPGSRLAYSLNRRTASLPLVLPRARSFMDVDVLPQIPARRKADAMDDVKVSIRRTPVNTRESKRTRLVEVPKVVGRRQNRHVSKLAKTRKAFCKRTKGVVSLAEPDPNAYPFCFPQSYPTDLQVLQQLAPHHFSPRAVPPVSQVVQAPLAPVCQEPSASNVLQVDYPMASVSAESLAALSSQPVGLGLTSLRTFNAQRITRRAHKLHRPHATAKSRAVIDKTMKQSMPRAIRKATQLKKVPRGLKDIRKAAMPYLGSFEWKRCRAYHPVWRPAPLDIPIDLEERMEILAATFDRAGGDVDMAYDEIPSCDDTIDVDQEDMEVYFTPLPSSDMLWDAFAEPAAVTIPSMVPVAPAAPVVYANPPIPTQIADTSAQVLPDYEEDVSAQAAHVGVESQDKSDGADQVPAKLTSGTYLMDALLHWQTASAPHVDDEHEDFGDVEEDDVWYEAYDEQEPSVHTEAATSSTSRTALLAQADAFLKFVGDELRAAGASADSATSTSEALLDELFGGDTADEDVFGYSTVSQSVEGSSRDGESSRRAVQYRPVPGVSFDD